MFLFTPLLHRGAMRRQCGFSLIELSVVLIVIGLLVGAVAVGRDLQRSAANQRLSTDFIQGWQLAYEAYFNGVGYPPGDDPANPTGRINGSVAPGNTELCGTSMINAFLAAGVRIPAGRAEGLQDRYAYLDSNGNPQELQVCFQNTLWSEPSSTVGTYVQRPRNLMVIKGVTYALAAALDQQIDGRADARFGSLREASQASNVAPHNAGQIWSINEQMEFQTNAQTSRDESQVAVTNAFFKMMR